MPVLTNKITSRMIEAHRSGDNTKSLLILARNARITQGSRSAGWHASVSPIHQGWEVRGWGHSPIQKGHIPSTSYASPSPGQGGMVTATTAKGS
jgi:hypothetical protein